MGASSAHFFALRQPSQAIPQAALLVAEVSKTSDAGVVQLVAFTACISQALSPFGSTGQDDKVSNTRNIAPNQTPVRRARHVDIVVIRISPLLPYDPGYVA